MTRQEFLKELRMALQGEISQRALEEHIGYYENYIMEESRKGRNEEDIIEELGSPRLIAKTLIDTTEQFGRASNQKDYTEDYRQTSKKEKKGLHANYSDTGGWEIRFGKLKLNSWYGKIIMLLLAIGIIVVAAHIVAFLLPIILIVVLVLLVISQLFGSRR